MSGQKKFYQRWQNITEKSKLINECRMIGNVFNRINLLIKSVTDNAFSDDMSTKIKIDAINRIFLNMNLGLGDSLKRWREVNQIEKLRNKMSQKQKEMCIKVLLGIINNGNQSKIREVINKFKHIRKITDIQRNFLKRLLMSKAGMVLIAFKNWKNLP